MQAAYACINSKRVDLLIVDADCKPLHAIEYQGGAHFKGAHATAARDAVKKEALRRAGIGYVEVVAGDTPAELRRVVRAVGAEVAQLKPYRLLQYLVQVYGLRIKAFCLRGGNHGCVRIFL